MWRYYGKRLCSKKRSTYRSHIFLCSSIIFTLQTITGSSLCQPNYRTLLWLQKLKALLAKDSHLYMAPVIIWRYTTAV